MDYRNKIVLAPMVRVGTLPTRLLSIDYGADLVYCEEIIDFKMLQAQTVQNDLLGTVDFVLNDGTIVFRTCSRESDKLIFQIGTADPKRALEVAKRVEKYVAGIDVNMGCPKEFSIKGGMGAALLTKPEKVSEILTALVQGLSVPVTCKIRILSTVEETLSLVRVIERTGVAAIAIHGRMKEERPRHQNHNDFIQAIAKAVNVPIIANGGSKEIKCYDDILKFQENTCAAGVMLARAAQWNPSIFRKQGQLPIDDVIKAYLKYAVDYDSVWPNTKYCLQQIFHQFLDSPTGQNLQAATSLREICEIWNMEVYYDEVQVQRQKRKEMLGHVGPGGENIVKKRRLQDGSELHESPVRYEKSDYPKNKSPKMTLYEWTVRQKIPKPSYESEFDIKQRMYYSILILEGKKYASTLWDMSKRCAEQAAAIVCLRVLGIDDERKHSVHLAHKDSHRDGKDNGTPSDGETKETVHLHRCNKDAATDVSNSLDSAQPHPASTLVPNTQDYGVSNERCCGIINPCLGQRNDGIENNMGNSKQIVPPCDVVTLGENSEDGHNCANHTDGTD